MAYQRVTPIYDTEAIKNVALQIINEIKIESPEILNSLCTVSLYSSLGEYSELTGGMTYYKSISRGTIYSATMYINSEGNIRTTPSEGYSVSQDIYYLDAIGASVPNPYNFLCVWLNIVSPGVSVNFHKTSVPGIRYYQQILNTSSQKNISVNNVDITVNDNESFLYNPTEGFSIQTLANDSINIGLICDNTERTLEEIINAKSWQLIN